MGKLKVITLNAVVAVCTLCLGISCDTLSQESAGMKSFSAGGLLKDWQFGHGSWYGHQLHENAIGLATPIFVHSNTDRHFEDDLLVLAVTVDEFPLHFDLRNQSQLLGLSQIVTSADLNIDFFLHFQDSVTSLVKGSFHNQTDREITVNVEFEVSEHLEQKADGHWTAEMGDMWFDMSCDPESWQNFRIPIGQTVSSVLVFNGCFERSSAKSFREVSFEESSSSNWEDVLMYTANWSSYSNEDLNLAQKSLQTLLNNWRSANGNLKFDGIFPSYYPAYFNGVWAWDSWKHAAALSKYNPELGANQVRCMLGMMDEHGMVADVFYRNDSVDYTNWRNTKPPLASWAANKIFSNTGADDFCRIISPQLLAYHNWWYENRDHDNNGFCEYGSTDGTLIAAAWESGMDNAVRFDKAQMLQNNPHAWSMNQESVDLNAYLIKEKFDLAEIIASFDKEVADSLRATALPLIEKFQDHFWDEVSGYYYDRRLGGELIKVMGPEGWIPLWAELASDDQARRVVDIISDTTHFNTQCPFPTLDAAHPEFNPENGYWRGPVWLDQAYFALKGMRNYGHYEIANDMQAKLLANGEGITEPLHPIMENYHPLTGAGLNAPHFSWSAAHLLLMLEDGNHR